MDKQGKYLKTLKESTVWTLAGMADCSAPDSKDSPGAQWLESIRDQVAEVMDDQDFDLDKFRDEDVSRMADEAVETLESRGTWGKWRTFVDLGAWQQDASDLGEPKNMDQGADNALYMIATQLMIAIAQEYEAEVSPGCDDCQVTPEHAWRSVASTPDDDH